MLFMQAVIYDLANPDDGLCPTYTTAAICLKEKSSMSSSQSKCIWDLSHEKCSFRPISSDGFVLVLVAVVSGILIAPFVISMQSLITHVLAASTRTASSKSTVKKRTQVTALSRDRRVEALSPDQAESPHGIQTNLLQDFKQLTQELDLHRASLSSDQLAEFNRKWSPGIPSFSCCLTFLSSLLSYSDVG
jgi:hypothetical protein